MVIKVMLTLMAAAECSVELRRSSSENKDSNIRKRKKLGKDTKSHPFAKNKKSKTKGKGLRLHQLPPPPPPVSEMDSVGDDGKEVDWAAGGFQFSDFDLSMFGDDQEELQLNQPPLPPPPVSEDGKELDSASPDSQFSDFDMTMFPDDQEKDDALKDIVGQYSQPDFPKSRSEETWETRQWENEAHFLRDAAEQGKKCTNLIHPAVFYRVLMAQNYFFFDEEQHRPVPYRKFDSLNAIMVGFMPREQNSNKEVNSFFSYEGEQEQKELIFSPPTDCSEGVTNFSRVVHEFKKALHYEARDLQARQCKFDLQLLLDSDDGTLAGEAANSMFLKKSLSTTVPELEAELAWIFRRDPSLRDELLSLYDRSTINFALEQIAATNKIRQCQFDLQLLLDSLSTTVPELVAQLTERFRQNPSLRDELLRRYHPSTINFALEQIAATNKNIAKRDEILWQRDINFVREQIAATNKNIAKSDETMQQKEEREFLDGAKTKVVSYSSLHPTTKQPKKNADADDDFPTPNDDSTDENQ